MSPFLSLSPSFPSMYPNPLAPCSLASYSWHAPGSASTPYAPVTPLLSTEMRRACQGVGSSPCFFGKLRVRGLCMVFRAGGHPCVGRGWERVREEVRGGGLGSSLPSHIPSPRECGMCTRGMCTLTLVRDVYHYGACHHGGCGAPRKRKLQL